MAISLENLIDLDLLTYYDENIKKYIANKVSNAAGTTRFMPVEDLPIEGKEDILYVTDEGIKVWNPDTKKYEDAVKASTVDQTWSTY